MVYDEGRWVEESQEPGGLDPNFIYIDDVTELYHPSDRTYISVVWNKPVPIPNLSHFVGIFIFYID